jgi:hypothetical protein
MSELYDGLLKGNIQGVLTGYITGVPSAEQMIAAMVAIAPAQIRRVYCQAAAGGSATVAVIDLRINSVSCYTNPANRPQLAAGQSGKFTSYPPDRSAVQPGDLIALVAVSSGNKSQIVATAALEEP